MLVAKQREQKMQTRFVSPIHKKTEVKHKTFFLLLFTNSQKEYIYIYFLMVGKSCGYHQLLETTPAYSSEKTRMGSLVDNKPSTN